MNKKLARSMIFVTAIIMIAKMLGFIRQIITGNAFGTTIDTDLIMLGQGTVQDLDFVLSQTLITSFIPIYLAEKKQGNHVAKGFASNIFKIVIALGILSTLGLWLFAPIISRILAPSYTTELSSQLATYIRIYSTSFVFIAEIGVFNALLKANEHFYAGEMIGIFQSLSFIGCIVFLKRIYGVNTLNIAFFLSVFICFAFLFVLSKKYWSIEKGNPFKNKSVVRFLKTTGIVLFGYSMIFVNQQVDKIIVSGMGDGIITAVHYGAVLSNFVCTIIASMGGILFTYITNAIIENADREAASMSFRFAKIFTLYLIPATAIGWVYSESIVRLIFGRGEFNETSVLNCAMALKGYCISFVPFVFRELYGRMLYAYEESKHVTINSTLSILVNILLSVILSRTCGVVGVTLASSIAVIICAFLNLYHAHKKNEYVDLREMLQHIFRWIGGLIVFYIIVILLKKIQIRDVLKIVLTTVLCFGVSTGLLKKEIKGIIELTKRKK